MMNDIRNFKNYLGQFISLDYVTFGFKGVVKVF